MKFDDLDRRMRVFETAHDHAVLPGVFIVARLDGRGFTRLTKDVCDFDRPFDLRFRDLMLNTAAALLAETGVRGVYGYTQSDEISLLLHRGEDAFGRKLRKLNSVLAGEASARFSLALGRAAAFDCRLSQLPRAEDVVDYFRWRQADAGRNALNAHCYWLLRDQGETVAGATNRVAGLTTSAKNELLFAHGVNYNDLPAWQKRGCGLWWEQREKQGVDPRTNTPTTAHRRNLRREHELPLGDTYADLLAERLAEASA